METKLNATAISAGRKKAPPEGCQEAKPSSQAGLCACRRTRSTAIAAHVERAAAGIILGAHAVPARVRAYHGEGDIRGLLEALAFELGLGGGVPAIACIVRLLRYRRIA